MQVSVFLEKLNKLFDADRVLENFEERVSRYSKLLASLEEKNGKIDYESTIDKILMNYPYKVYPNFTEIMKNLVYFKKEKPPQIDNQRTFIITFKNGITYEFVETHSDAKGITSYEEIKDKIEKLVVLEP